MTSLKCFENLKLFLPIPSNFNNYKFIYRKLKYFKKNYKNLSTKNLFVKKNIKFMEWNPDEILHNSKNKNYGILTLNREILCPSDIVIQLWENAKIRITVDGGTNRWLDFIKKQNLTYLQKPDIISGDFDSVSEEALNYFNESKKIHTPDQDDTDFTKALKILNSTEINDLVPDNEGQITHVIVLCESSGRLDQIMGNINTILKAKTFLSGINTYLLSSNSLTWILEPCSLTSEHSIKIPKALVEKKGWCSMIPLTASTVATEGLKWNLNNEVMEFGGIVSTSNTYQCDTIKLSTTGFLLWSMGMFNFSDNV